jgi:nucleoside-diphosphate kinase
MIERTLCVLKPDVVASSQSYEIFAILKRGGFLVVKAKWHHMTLYQANAFYGLHQGKLFYKGLCDFMSKGSSIILVLEREDAVPELRRIMGAVRAQYAEPSGPANAIHGSDSVESAAQEINFWFAGYELL